MDLAVHLRQCSTHYITVYTSLHGRVWEFSRHLRLCCFTSAQLLRSSPALPSPNIISRVCWVGWWKVTWLVGCVGWCVGCLDAGAGHCVTVLAGWWWRASVGGRAQHTWAARETEQNTTRHRSTPHTAAQHQPPPPAAAQHMRTASAPKHCVRRPPGPPPRSRPASPAAPPYMAVGMFCDGGLTESQPAREESLSACFTSTTSTEIRSSHTTLFTHLFYENEL